MDHRTMTGPNHDGMFSVDAVALKKGLHYVYGCAVAGDVAEFGCYLGRTAAILAETMAQCDAYYGGSQQVHGIAERKLWVFDSFEGFPQASTAPDKAAPHIQSGVWAAGSCRGATPIEVFDRLATLIRPGRITVCPGWFKDTLITIPKETRFAFVHLDCDYYESTGEVLNHLIGKNMLSDGCTLYFDDWYCNRGSPKFGQQRAWQDFHRVIDYTDWGPYGVAGRRFIVHK